MVNNDVVRDKKVIGIDSIIVYTHTKEIVYNASDIADFEELAYGSDIIIKLTSGLIKLYRNVGYSINGRDNSEYLHHLSTL